MSRSISKTRIKLAFLLDENVDVRVALFLFANPDLHDFTKTAGIIVLRLHPPKLELTLSILEKLFQKIPPGKFSKTLFVVTKERIEITRKSSEFLPEQIENY